jgi:alkylhydroperoxidase family enzyme
MSRLPVADRETLAPEHKALWDRIAAARGGTVRGPSGILMHLPALADRVFMVDEYFRSSAELPAADRELVILAAAREMEARFAWARHEVRAREAGTPADAVEVLRALGSPEKIGPREGLLVEIVRSLTRTHGLSDELYGRGIEELGPRQMIETVTLVGHYCLIGLIVNGFAILEESQTF